MKIKDENMELLKKKRVISTFMLAMINVAMIVSLRSLPTLAKYGVDAVLLCLFAAAFLFIPVAFVSAELATSWPEEGGIFLWASKAFSQKWGVLAIFLQWVMSVVWYPLALTVTVAMLAYSFNPGLAENKYYAFIMVQLIYWGATLLNFKGLKTSSRFSSLAVGIGTLLPAVLLIFSGIVWMFMGGKVQIPFSFAEAPINFGDFKSFILLTSSLLMYAGMEVSSVHVKEVDDPKKSYPKAIFLAVIVILTVSIFGTLSIAIAVPEKELSLVTGVLQSFAIFFQGTKLAFLVPVLAFLIALGSIGQVSTWILGPSKAVLSSAKSGSLPAFLAKVNKNNIPVNILLLQAVLVSVFAFLFLFMPSVSSSFWMFTVLTAQLYFTMYILLFLSALKLRFSKLQIERTYKVPGGNPGLWFFCLVGISACLMGIFLGFFPPKQVATISPLGHALFLVTALTVCYSIPFLIYYSQKKKIFNK